MNTLASPPPILCLTMNPSVDVATHTEQVLPTHKLRCATAQRDPGGGGLNVARVIQRLGGVCSALLPAGGPSGQWLAHRLAQEGLQAVCIPIAQETRESFTVQALDTGAEYRFVMPGPYLDESEWQACLDRIAQLPLRPGVLVASGSLPPGVPVDFYARLARWCQTVGTRLVLDTSGEPLAAALAQGVYLVKPNLHELAGLCGHALDTPGAWREAARAWIDRGQAEVVALTLGERGAELFTRAHSWSAAPLPIEVSSSVGAGDSFVAALVWSLARQESLEKAFAWAMAAGSAALITPGTGLCLAGDVQRLQQQVRVVAIPH